MDKSVKKSLFCCVAIGELKNIGRQDTHPSDQICSIFMQFSGKIRQIVGWRPLKISPPFWEILDPPLLSVILEFSGSLVKVPNLSFSVTNPSVGKLIWFTKVSIYCSTHTVADPGFPKRGTNPFRRIQTIIWSISPKLYENE